MNPEHFERLVERVVDGIPREFLGRIENLTFRVEDWADPETLEESGCEDPGDLLGFYHGLPLPERSHEYVELPDCITVYQKAVENHARETGLPLMKVVRETVLHEIAHYFGFSEEEMDEVERIWEEKRGSPPEGG